MLRNLVEALALHPALSHVVIALGLQIIIALVLGLARVQKAWWFGAVFAIAFYFSRKKLEVEFHADPLGVHKDQTWMLGWLPPYWPWPYQVQFYAPACAVIICALIVPLVQARFGLRSGRR